MLLFESVANNWIRAVVMAAGQPECSFEEQYATNLHRALPCRMLAHMWILATGFLADSAILAHATIVNGWPVGQDTTHVTRNQQGCPYSIRAAIDLAVSVPKSRRLDFLRRP